MTRMVKKWPAQENNIFFPLYANKTSVILLPVEFSQRSAFLHAEELSWSTHKMERTCYVKFDHPDENPKTGKKHKYRHQHRQFGQNIFRQNQSPSAAKDAVKLPQRPI
jgi:hypothetical protein